MALYDVMYSDGSTEVMYFPNYDKRKEYQDSHKDIVDIKCQGRTKLTPSTYNPDEWCKNGRFRNKGREL